MTDSPTMTLARLSRDLTRCAREAGLIVPQYRGTPEGQQRSIVFDPNYPERAVVKVEIRGRTDTQIADDLVVGTIRINQLDDDSREAQALWDTVTPAEAAA